MLKFFLPLLAAFGLVACGPQEAALTSNWNPDLQSKVNANIPVPKEAIRFVDCGTMAGTAFQIGAKKYMTAEHVIAGGGCKDYESGESFTITETNRELDYAILEVTNVISNSPLKLNCTGFKADETYRSIGWASGNAFLSSPAIATGTITPVLEVSGGRKHLGMRKLDGLLVPGMSGGPIVHNRTGVVSGVNNITLMYSLQMHSRELKDTSVCKR